MKKLLFLLGGILLLMNSISASHSVGGTIWYEYIGDSTGIPFHYEIHLELLRRNENTSVTLGNTAQISITSSCYSSQTLTLTRLPASNGIPAGDGGTIPASGSTCNYMIQNDTNFFNISTHHYIGTIVLPGKCFDFLFEYSLCCINAGVTNIIMPSSRNIYLEARLNNVPGPNDSPHFVLPPSSYYCVGKTFVNSFYTIEPDGDSLFYFLAKPLHNSTTPIDYATGYTQQNPISTLSGIQFDSTNGLMQFTPIQVENDMIKIKVREFRLVDSVNHTYNLVGVISRQHQIIIGASCDSTQAFWAFKTDSLGIDSSINPACMDSMVTFKTKSYFLTSSLAQNGSDFTIYSNSTGAPIPIKEASASPTDSGSIASNEVSLHLAVPIYYDDIYTVYSKVGTDTNTLLSICGEELPPNDSVSFVVSSCQTNFKLNEATKPLFNMYPSPTSSILNIEIEDASSVNNLIVTNSLGHQMHRLLNIRESIQLDVSSFSSGVYFVSIQTSSGTSTTRKFIKL